MAYAPAIEITLFEPAEEGYLLAFAAGGEVLSRAVREIVTLDMWQRHWIPELRAWWIADGAISLLARRLPAVAEALEQLRARPIDIRDYVSGDWANPRPRVRRPLWAPWVPREVVSAYSRLGLAPGATLEEVTEARRTLARRHHPDAGGEHEAMVAINAAADTVTRWLEQRGQRV